MAGTNEFLPFALGVGANVIAQADYAALSQIASGYQAGTALSNQVNKTLRQATFVAAAMAQIIANNNVNALDNGNVTTFVTNLLAALFNAPALTNDATGKTQTIGNNSTRLATTAFIANTLTAYYTASQIAANFATLAEVNAAQNTANTANNVATNALNSAGAAQTAANNAQTSANNALVQHVGSLFPFGVGGYQGDIAGARAFNTNFNNSYGRVILVFVRIALASTTTHAEAYVNGVPAAHGFSFTNAEGNLCFIVPQGANYQVNRLSGNGSVAGWYEIH